MLAALGPLARPAPPTTFSAAPGGMEGLYRLLGREGVAVGRRTASPLPSSALLVGAAGPRPLTPAEARRLLRWIGAGHRGVILGAVPALAQALGVGLAAVPWGGGSARPAVALPGLQGAGRLQLPAGVALLPLAAAHGEAAPLAAPLYVGSLGQPVALAITVGRGHLDWFGSAALWSNATLARWPGNLALAARLLDGRGPVAFDEYWFGRGLAPGPAAPARPAAPPLPRDAVPAAAALICALAAGLWATGWRRHPVRPRPAAAPTDAEPIRARAEWLWRARGTAAGPRKGDSRA